MFTGIFDPAFLQAASAHAAQPTPPEPEPDGIVIRTNVTGTIEPNIECTGTITVKSIYNGEEQIAQYTNLDSVIEILSDANTDIIITGGTNIGITFSPGFGNKLLSIRALNSNLKKLQFTSQSTLTTLCLPSSFTNLNGSPTMTGLTKIMYPANNNSISTTIANAITNAIAADGVVYLDENGDYYDTIANAATAKGWTIEQL